MTLYPPTPHFLEIVQRVVPPFGQAAMIKAILRGAVFKPLCNVMIRAGHFVAEIEFEEPLGPEKQSSLIVMLGVHPEREEGSADTAAELGGDAA